MQFDNAALYKKLLLTNQNKLRRCAILLLFIRFIIDFAFLQFYHLLSFLGNSFRGFLQTISSGSTY
jgi:hypothetical protein